MRTFILGNGYKAYHCLPNVKEAKKIAKEIGIPFIGEVPGVPFWCESCGIVSYEQPKENLKKCSNCDSEDINIMFDEEKKESCGSSSQ